MLRIKKFINKRTLFKSIYLFINRYFNPDIVKLLKVTQYFDKFSFAWKFKKTWLHFRQNLLKKIFIKEKTIKKNTFRESYVYWYTENELVTNCLQYILFWGLGFIAFFISFLKFNFLFITGTNLSILIITILTGNCETLP